MPREEYNEKARRTIIDILIYSALDVVNKFTPDINRREVVVEESLFNEQDYELPAKPNEIIGSGPLDYVIPEGFVVFARKEDENKEFMEEEMDEEEDEIGGSSTAAPLTITTPFVDIEAKVTLNDRSLYQLLGQMHDAMYVKVEEQGTKRKLEAEDGGTRVKLNRNKIVGILCTGHTAEVYTIRFDETSRMKVVKYHGKRSIKILRYLPSTNRTLSIKVTDSSQLFEIIESELKDMLLLLMALFLNFV